MSEEVSKGVKVVLASVLLFAVVFASVGVHKIYITVSSDVTTIELQVTDKHVETNVLLAGKIPVPAHSYKLVVNLEGTPYDVATTSSIYDQVAAGESLLFDVSYLKGKLTKISVSTGNVVVRGE